MEQSTESPKPPKLSAGARMRGAAVTQILVLKKKKKKKKQFTPSLPSSVTCFFNITWVHYNTNDLSFPVTDARKGFVNF